MYVSIYRTDIQQVQDLFQGPPLEGDNNGGCCPTGHQKINNVSTSISFISLLEETVSTWLALSVNLYNVKPLLMSKLSSSQSLMSLNPGLHSTACLCSHPTLH